MKCKVKVLIPILFLCILSSCITTKETNLLQDIDKNYPAQTTYTTYRIIPGDQLQLTIYSLDPNMRALFSMFMHVSSGTSEMDNNATSAMQTRNGANFSLLNVYSDGSVNIPYAGKVFVKDLSIMEAQKIIADRLSQFSNSVQVKVILSNRYFSVLGEAGYARVLMKKPRLTIYEALSTSGAINLVGDRSKVKIIRQTTTGTEVKVFDLRSKDIVNSEFYYIQPNDVIYVPRMKGLFFGRISTFNDIFAIVATTIGAGILITKLVQKF